MARSSRRSKKPVPKPAPAPADPYASNLDVVLTRFVHKSAEGDYAVAVGRAEADGSEVRITGPLCHAKPGEALTLDGGWSQHVKYGWQFQARGSTVRRPTTQVGMEEYLRGALHGVGPVFARKIVEHFGDKTLEILDTEPQRLREVPGVGRVKVEEAMRHWQEARANRETMLFLSSFSLTDAMKARIYKAWGDQTQIKLKQNPYQLTELDGIGFRKADEVAKKMGVALTDPHRIEACIQFVLVDKGEKGAGHCFLKMSELLRAAGDELVGADRDQVRVEDLYDMVDQAVTRLADKHKVVKEPSVHGDEPHVYSISLWKAEVRLANKVRSLCESPDRIGLPEKLQLPNEEFSPTDEQLLAVQRALRHPLSIMTGGPGVGKTASTKLLCDLAESYGVSMALCAPTGKAAKRMAEATGREAKTIHRLLKWNPMINGFEHGPKNPLPYQLLIVDECSMVDLRLADKLFQAVGDHTHVLLVGDTDQLPPVGAGKALQDLIVAGQCPITHLTKIFRQAARSMIIQAAYDVNRGVFPEDDPERLMARDEVQEQLGGESLIQDYFLIERNENADIVQLTLEYAAERIPRRYGFDPIDEVQVLAPQSTTEVGIHALNLALQSKLNPTGEPTGITRRFRAGGRDYEMQYRVGDKLLNTRNDYNHDIMNGELARIVDYDSAQSLVMLETDRGRIEMGVTDVRQNFVLAYAMSIHKSQGSSAKAVILPLSTSTYMMLTRNLLYTGITRAEELVMVIGQKRALQVAVKTPDTQKRNSSLAERLLYPNLSGQLV